MIKYLSPSSIGTFRADKSEFFVRYLMDDRPDRTPQNAAMAVGSAFDAYTKSYLHNALFGAVDARFELRTLFESAGRGRIARYRMGSWSIRFQCYKESGALADLMLEMKGSVKEPRFEFEVMGAIAGSREARTTTIKDEEVGEVVLLGKPDVSFVSGGGKHVILDWKVNGFYSRTAPAAMRGYVRMRAKGMNYGWHKSAHILNIDGMVVNVANYLEEFKEDWASQLAIYAWLCGESVGGDFVVAINQLVCDASATVLPQIKVAEHRLKISPAFQHRLYDEICEIWEVVHSDHFFRDMTKEDSAARCELLREQAKALRGDGSSNDKWFSSATRGV